MNYTSNFNLRLPERNEQFNLDDWNNNTSSIDSAMQTNKTNISNNATNITSILTGLSTVNTEDTSSIFYKLMKLIYPVGSIYWSGNSTNPGTLFGGTWTQIKDRFVLACGDTYKTVSATGGASSVTLAVANIPSHTHTFNGSAVTSGANNRGHTHGYAHTHGYTPSGKIASTSGGTDNKTTTPDTDTVTIKDPKHRHDFSVPTNVNVYGGSATSYSGTSTTTKYTSYNSTGITASHSHTHTAYFTGTAGTTTSQSTTTSDDESQNHTHSVTASGTNGNTGGGQAHDNMPPYIVKYCWQRTA